MESIVYSRRIIGEVALGLNFYNSEMFPKITPPRSSPVDNNSDSILFSYHDDDTVDTDTVDTDTVDTDSDDSDGILFTDSDHYEDEEKNRILTIEQLKAVNEKWEEGLLLPIINLPKRSIKKQV